MKKSNNPSAIRSREMITQALLSLMEKKQFKDITIKEISHKANLDRRTFYRNFNSKEDILMDYVNLLIKKLSESIIAKQNFNLYSIWESYFDFWIEHLDFLKLIQNNQMLYFLLENFDKFRVRLHAFIDPSMSQDHIPEPLRYSLAFILGGLWSTLIKWLDEGATKSPSYMADIIRNTVKAPY